MPGQINSSSTLGRVIEKLAACHSFQNYVDVGTWNGEGSTACLMEGSASRSDCPLIWSIESSDYFYKIAHSYWLPLMSVSSAYQRLTILFGRLVDEEDLISVEEIQSDPRFQDSPWLDWRARNVSEYQTCPNVVDQLPESIDVLVLDGGQFSTRAEWKKLKGRTKVVVLDDTTTFKTDKVREDILSDSNWVSIIDDLSGRNGFMVACLKSVENDVRQAIAQ